MGISNNLVVLTALFTLGAAFRYGATPDPICPFPSNEITFLPYPTNCSKYIECFAGTKNIMECPSPLQWNQYATTCDYVCNGTGPITTAKPGPTPDNGCPATGNALLPNYGDCTKFFQCINGVKYPEVCPEGYAYSIAVQACQIKSTVDCSYVTPSPNPTTSNPNRRCPDNGLSYLPDYGDCTKYYQCFMGTETLMQCGEGLSWSIPISACDVKEHVDCSYTTIYPPTANPNNDCPSTGTSFFPYPYDCSKFYECNNGVKRLLDCPSGYRWSVALTSCELEAYVDCSYTSKNPASISRTIITITTQKPLTNKPTNAPTPATSCDGAPNGTLIPHPTDCSKFLECNNGDKTEMKCAPGTTFDPNLDVCDTNSDNCKGYSVSWRR